MPKKLQFGIGALLFLVLLLSGVFAAYRVGYRFGYESGLRDKSSDQYVTRVYGIEDLVVPVSLQEAPSDIRNANADVESLIEIITTQISPEIQEEGVSVQLHDDSLSLVITLPHAEHAQVNDLLESLRKQKRRFELRGNTPSLSF